MCGYSQSPSHAPTGCLGHSSLTARTPQFLLISLLVMLLCTAGWHCGYNRLEKWCQVILVTNMVFLCTGLVSLAGLVVWDLTTGHQTLTGRCVWTGGYCLWIGGLTSLVVCLAFLTVNCLAYSGIRRSNSWVEKHPNTSYKLIYPWLALYFLANCALLPVGIGWVYIWYEDSPSCSESEAKFKFCQEDILYSLLPVICCLLLLVLLISLHNWVLLLHLTKSLRSKLNPSPFVMIGSRIVLGLQDTSHGDQSRSNSTLSKSSTLISYVYP